MDDFGLLAPVEQKITAAPAPAANLNVIGMSSEWFGSSNLGAALFPNEGKSFERSKVRMNCLYGFPSHWL